MFHVEQRLSWSQHLITGCLGLGISINEIELSKFSIYLTELRAWNRKMNLSGFDDPDEIAIKHFLDSLVGGKVLNDQTRATVLDVGSGGGFPGLPLKILFPFLSLRLLEPSSKKTAFLRHVIGTLELTDVSVLPKRVEELANDPNQTGQYDFVLTRAVNLEEILSATLPLLKTHGKVIAWRTREFESSLPHGLHRQGEFVYSLTPQHGERRLIILEKQ